MIARRMVGLSTVAGGQFDRGASAWREDGPGLSRGVVGGRELCYAAHESLLEQEDKFTKLVLLPKRKTRLWRPPMSLNCMLCSHGTSRRNEELPLKKIL